MSPSKGIAIPGVTLPTKIERAKIRHFAESIRGAILHGKLRPGERLPSSRAAADFYGLSRTTVRVVYDELIQEGYLVAVRGSGTSVSTELSELSGVKGPGHHNKASSIEVLHHTSQRGILMRNTGVTVARNFFELRPFRAWLPSFKDFPLALWGRISRREWSSATERSLKYGGPQGLRRLREAIRAHIARERGISCAAEQIIIVAGSQEALFLSALVLGDPGGQVAVENPGYLGAKGAFLAAGLQSVPISVDAEGLVFRELAKKQGIRLVFLTPSHQYPSGVTLSLARRIELLQWAKENMAYLLEDDYDSDFRYTPRAIPALHALDTHERVIYIGSFSKVLIPSIRLGYLVLPPDLVEPFLRARALIDRGSPSLDQATLATFIEEGHFDSHIRKMRKLYQQRQEILLESLDKFCSGYLETKPSSIGMHVVGSLDHGLTAKTVASRGKEAGLELTPLSDFSMGGPCRNEIMLGYTALSPSAIREGARVLGKVLRSAS
jgi:GntR family transcriptional regulator/MocR family aminotransferase